MRRFLTSYFLLIVAFSSPLFAAETKVEFTTPGRPDAVDSACSPWDVSALTLSNWTPWTNVTGSGVMQLLPVNNSAVETQRFFRAVVMP